MTLHLMREVDEKMKQCPYCGQELNKSDKQCSNWKYDTKRKK